MNPRFKSTLIVSILALMVIIAVFGKTMPDLNKPAPEWFKMVVLGFVGIMGLVIGGIDAVRLLQGKTIYIASRVTPTRTESRGFLAIVFTFIWLGAGVFFSTIVLLSVLGTGQH